MGSIPEAAIAASTEMPRFGDGSINLQEVLRQLAESVVNEVTGVEADQLCEATGNSRNGYRERMLVTCVGTLMPRVPKLRSGSFFPEDALERHRRVDRAVVAAVAEMYATGTSTRKVQRVTSAMDIERMSESRSSPPGARRDLGEVPPLRARGVDGRGHRDRLRLGGLEARPGHGHRRHREPRLVVRVPRQGQGPERARREARHLRRPRGPQARGRGDLPGTAWQRCAAGSTTRRWPAGSAR